MARRNTKQRDAVRDVLASTPGFVSAQQLHTAMREDTGIGLATVYRNLALLADDGEADALQSPSGETLYRACATDTHHHHLICTTCGKAVEISAEPVEQWARETAASYGFSDAQHVIDIFGVCDSCAEAGS